LRTWAREAGESGGAAPATVLRNDTTAAIAVLLTGEIISDALAHGLLLRVRPRRKGRKKKREKEKKKIFLERGRT
jgi:hypothetical protein